MKISITNQTAEEILVKLNENKSINLSPKVSYKIITNKLKIEQELQPFIKTKNDIISRFSGGKATISQKDNPVEFTAVMKEISEIAAEKIDIDFIGISIDELGENPLPFSFMEAINFMIGG